MPRLLGLGLAFCLGLLIVGCAADPPQAWYPDEDPAQIGTGAQKISDDLDAYADEWLTGNAPAELPAEVLPEDTNPNLGTFKLVRPGEVTAEQQWVVRGINEIDFDVLYNYHADPNVNYLHNPSMFVPFDHRVFVDGEFPHSRFFDFQVSTPRT